uniref:Uncharacterized protein n=1 Tax=Seriola dumerili TaxID=41447 RepID=A0A3B4T2M2_SERDU
MHQDVVVIAMVKTKWTCVVGGFNKPPLIFFQDTPIPGLYHIRDFIEEADLNPVRKTYGFKGVGRKAQTLGVRNGDLLLPGAYDYTDSTQEVLMHQASYSFKNCPRPDIVTLGIRDKPSPHPFSLLSSPCRHVIFRSTVQRISFPPVSIWSLRLVIRTIQSFHRPQKGFITIHFQ